MKKNNELEKLEKLDKNIKKKVNDTFGVDVNTLLTVLLRNPGAMGYLHGALSEEKLKKQLIAEGCEVYRIKEKPAGGFDEKKEHYKGDFLIKLPGQDKYMVVESKGLKTNSEFRGDNKIGSINKTKIINKISRLLNDTNQKKYDSGFKRYSKKKSEWESKNPGKKFPEFSWNIEYPGASSIDLSQVFRNKTEVKDYFNNISNEKFEEKAFREKNAAYYILETHKPSNRIDPITGIKQAAPLKSEFSILAVDLYQKYGEHFFVFADSNELPHSPTSPNHLYQNYEIDILIPGLKNDLNINKPWFTSISELIKHSSPRTVDFDISQVDERVSD